MQEKVLKLNEYLEISAGDYHDGITIFIAESDGPMVAIPLEDWERMIAWWQKVYPEMLREKLEERE